MKNNSSIERYPDLQFEPEYFRTSDTHNIFILWEFTHPAFLSGKQDISPEYQIFLSL